MSLIATGLAVVGGILLGRLVGSSLFEKKKPPPGKEEERKEGEGGEPAEEGGAPTKGERMKSAKIVEPQLDGFPCRLGDVILRSTGEEAWLAGAIVLNETDGPPLLALFFSPDSGGDRVVLAEPAVDAALLWLQPIVDPGVRGEPPSALEHDGAHFDRRRRLPLHAARLGTGTPDVARSLIFAEYTGIGDSRLVVLSGDGACHAYLGQSLLAGSYDVLPSGKSTLEA